MDKRKAFTLVELLVVDAEGYVGKIRVYTNSLMGLTFCDY